MIVHRYIHKSKFRQCCPRVFYWYGKLKFTVFFLFSGIQRRPRIRSPEDSTLSICGDSQSRELSLDEGCSSLPGTSRDDSSELSFYRRFIEGHVTRTHSTRSCEIPHRGIRSNISFPGEQCEHSGSDKSKKPGYRPYTIEEYRSLSVPRPDRSLGPDKDEIQAKVHTFLWNNNNNNLHYYPIYYYLYYCY